MRSFFQYPLILLGILLLGGVSAPVRKAHAQETSPAKFGPVATMPELMSRVILPTSNAVLYVASRTPETDEEWTEFQTQALLLAESAVLMMTPGRASQELLDDERWVKDTQVLYDAGKKAYEAALAKDVEALAELNDPLYTSCIQCHEDFEVTY
jgi:hypothetical protein